MLHYFVYLSACFWIQLFAGFLAIELADLLPKVFIILVEKRNVHDISLGLLGLIVVCWGHSGLNLRVSLGERFLLGRALELLLVVER